MHGVRWPVGGLGLASSSCCQLVAIAPIRPAERSYSSGVGPCGKRGEGGPGPAHAGLHAREPTCFLKEIKGY